MTRCHACDNPIWSGPCTCDRWCKSYVCKKAFGIDTYEQWARANFTPTDYYEQRMEQRLAERLVAEPIDHPILRVRASRYYSLRDGLRERLVEEGALRARGVTTLSPHPTSDNPIYGTTP